MNENAVRAMARKARATRERRDARGDRRGSPPYGWRIAARKPGEPVTWEPDPDESVDAILAAYEAAGSFQGAAKLLNAPGGPEAPRGDTWYGSRVREILKAQRPDVTSVRATTARVAVGASAGAMFRRLLRCHCGGTPTPLRQRNGSYSYRCQRGHHDRVNHPVVQVSERVIREWAEGEAARFDPRREGSVGEPMAADETTQATLEAKRARIVDAFVDGTLDKPERDRRLALVDGELDAIEARRELVNIPAGIDWTWDPKAINAVLRTYWTHVELGPDLRPVRAEWRLPAEWLS